MRGEGEKKRERGQRNGGEKSGIEAGKGGGEKVYSIKATTTGCCIMAQIGKRNEWHDGMRNNGNFKMEISIT